MKINLGVLKTRGKDDSEWSSIPALSGGVGTDVSAVLQAVYPVGSVYVSTVSANPATLFGFGTWEQIKDTFLLAAGDAYTAGATGGEATHILTENEMPSHTHPQLGAAGDPQPNTSPVRLVFQSDGHMVVYDSTGKAIWYNSAMSNEVKAYRTTVINEDGVTGETGGGQPHNNMPPYLAVYVWKRTA